MGSVERSGSMLQKTIFAAAVAAFVAAAPMAFAAPQGPAMHDRGIAREIAQEMHKAGFTHVRHLKEGGDGYWHALADKNGTAVHVVRTPGRKIMQEGN